LLCRKIQIVRRIIGWRREESLPGKAGGGADSRPLNLTGRVS
jgi:hypothetical protein